MIDVNKLLQLDYLNEFIIKINNLIAEESKKKINHYSLDNLLSMDDEKIVSIFREYGLQCEYILEKKDSIFLEEGLEFAYLFEDDIPYSLEQKTILDSNAKKEVLELNKAIDLINEKNLEVISELKERVKFFELLIKIIEEKELIHGEDINELKSLILKSPLIKDSERFAVSLIVVKYLVKNGKKIIFVNDNIKTDEFDKLLDAVHGTSTYKETKEDELTKIPYQDVILRYYNTYKDLIDAAGYSDVFELMESSNDLNDYFDGDYLSKDDFCLRLGSLLYQLSNINDLSLENELLSMLSKLDVLYEENKKNNDKKNSMLIEINGFFSKIDGMDIVLLNKLRTRLKVLKSDLDEIFSSRRLEELELEFKDIKRHMNKLTEILNLVKQVNEYNKKITNIFNSSNLNKNDSLLLSSLQNKLLVYDEEILSNKEFDMVREEIYDCFKKIDEIQNRLEISKTETPSDDKKLNKILLKGFVLCDFDENNQPYILSDLEPSSKNKMIDKAIEPKKLKKGYAAYNKLLNDLFIVGNTEKLDNNDSFGYNTDRLNEPVYWDPKNRSHENETGMYRIKGERNGVERFVEQRIVLHCDSYMYKQVTDIIREIIPNVDFDLSNDINLYINYASAMKKDDEHLYNVAINRFKEKSPLYKMFNEPKNKTELTDEECDLLRDIIHMSFDAFSKLVNINPNLHLEVVKQIEEGRTRG